MITRRTTLTAGAAALTMPAVAQQHSTLRFVPHAALGGLDPVWTTSYVTRNAAALTWDTLYGLDAGFTPRPQMAEGHEEAGDGRLWRFRLREGLRVHDGSPVRAADAVASVRRWMARDTMGQVIAARLDSMHATDDRTFEIRLQRPFPQLAFALGKPESNMCFVMPERLAATPPTQAFGVADLVGSGPFRFVASEWDSGSRAVWERFADYRPAPGANSWTAGPKRAAVDRVEWRVIPDGGTAAAALQAGEVDWVEAPLPDLLPRLARQRGVALVAGNPLGEIGYMRFNHLHPPFDNSAVRRAVMLALSQDDWMAAITGGQARSARLGFYTPESPVADPAAVPAARPDPEAARRALAAAGYRGESVTIIVATDVHVPNAQSQVTADALRRAGMAVDYVAADWGAVVQRRANPAPPDRGGWNLFHSWTSGFGPLNPGTAVLLRGLGNTPGGIFGWPDSPRLEALIARWHDAPAPAQWAIAREVEAAAFEEMPYAATGQFFIPYVVRQSVRGLVEAPLPVFWGVSA